MSPRDRSFRAAVRRARNTSEPWNSLNGISPTMSCRRCWISYLRSRETQAGVKFFTASSSAFSVRFGFPSACDSIRVLLPAHDHLQLFRSAVLVGLDLYRVILAYLNFVVNLGSPVHKISNLNLGFTLNGDASSVAGFAC